MGKKRNLFYRPIEFWNCQCPSSPAEDAPPRNSVVMSMEDIATLLLLPDPLSVLEQTMKAMLEDLEREGVDETSIKPLRHAIEYVERLDPLQSKMSDKVH